MHLPYRLTDSETKCPADHRRRATEIVPVRGSGIERGARRVSEVHGKNPTPPLTPKLSGGKVDWLFVV